MAENLKAIRRRIRSVEATQKITSAMKMVAAAKLRRAQSRAEAGRPYSESIRSVLAALAAASGHTGNPLLQRRPVKRLGYVLLTGDRGLAGPFNTAVVRTLTADHMNHPEGKDPLLMIVGRKGVEHFRRRPYEIRETYVNVGDAPTYALAAEIGRAAVALYLSGEVDEVRMVYTRFVTAMTQRPVVETLIPITPPETGPGTLSTSYLFEPDEESVLGLLLPTYVASLLFGAILESKASEQGARMTAMDSATRAAGDLIKSLLLRRNRARQAAITREIAEIVGGAAALE